MIAGRGADLRRLASCPRRPPRSCGGAPRPGRAGRCRRRESPCGGGGGTGGRRRRPWRGRGATSRGAGAGRYALYVPSACPLMRPRGHASTRVVGANAHRPALNPLIFCARHTASPLLPSSINLSSQTGRLLADAATLTVLSIIYDIFFPCSRPSSERETPFSADF